MRPTVTLRLSPISIPENAGSSTVTATLNHPSSEETTITISVAPTSSATASDYTLSGSTLTIAAGATESTETVTITAVDNLLITTDKILTVQGTASNALGISGPADVELTITNPPTVSSATVDGTTLVVNFNKGLASVSGLTNSAFTVKKTPSGGAEEDQALSGIPIVSGETVTLTLSSPVIASDMGTVKVSYMAPTEPSAKLRDAEGNNVVDFVDLGVLNLRGGICSRTDVVRDAILRQITRTTFCYEVTSDDLRTITSLSLEGSNITELNSGDFNGLTSLQILDLYTNALTDLPEDLFDGLTSLRILTLDDNSLTDLHEDLFDGLTSLEGLTFDSNSLTDLHEDLFDGLTSLQEIWLEGNSLTDLHQDLFDGLTNLQYLYLGNNSLSSLHPDLFDGLTNLETLALGGNPLTCVPAKIFNRAGINIAPSSLAACPDPIVTLSVSPSSIGEEDEATEVTVTGALNILQATATPVTVSVGSGTATAGTDFTAVSDFTISIPGNNLSATGTFTLTPTSDTVDEPDETLMIIGTSTVEDVTVTETPLTITDDDDAPTVTLHLSSTSIGEDGESSTVTATLNHPSSEETTVTISVDPTSPATESDYSLSGSTLMIAAGATESMESVTITAEDNDVLAEDKIVTVQGTASNTQGISGPADVELTITDDDLELIVTLNLSSSSIGENAESTTVMATLNQASTEETTITVTILPDSPATESDVTLTGNILTIAAGETGSTGEVTVTAVDNLVDAPDKMVQVQGTAENTQGVTGPSAVELTITDDEEEPTVTLNLAAASIGEDGESSTVTATLDHASSEETMITISVLPDAPTTTSDYTLNGSTLTIAAGETESTETVTITAVNNPADEPDKTIQVQGTATNTQGITDPEDVELTITDDEESPTVTLRLSSSLIGEDGESTTVTAMLSHISSEQTTITISVLPDAPATTSDYTLNGSTLTIAAGQTSSTGQVTITSVTNDVDAPDKMVQVQGMATNAQGVTGPEDVGLTITDRTASPAVTLNLSPSSIGENVGTTTVTATLDRASSELTTITVSVLPDAPAAESDYTLNGSTLTIAAGETSSSSTVTITAVNNLVNAPDKTVQVQGIATNTQGVTQPTAVELTITDDDEAPMVTLSLSPTSISENAGSTTVTATQSHASSAPTTITITAAATLPALGFGLYAQWQHADDCSRANE